MTEIRIYVADLAAYNAGTLRGEWLTPTDFADAEDFAAHVTEWLATIPGHEEHAIHDYEAPEGITIGEYTPLDEVHALAVLLEEHGDAYAAYVSLVGAKYATEDGFQDAYCGAHRSGADYAEQLFEDTYSGPVDTSQWPFSCIDWERAWRELEFDGYSIVDGHVFSSR